MRRSLFIMFVFGICFFVPSFVSAQDYTAVPTGNEADTVYAVFFYMPTCPHCHDVIDDVFPEWYAEFGDQLVIVPVNASIQGTNTLFANACVTFSVPSNRCGSVPLMLIGNQYMLGGSDIPRIGTQLIRDGIANGGIPLPTFSGMDTYFATFQDAVAASIAEQPDDVVASSDTPVETIIESSPSLADRLAGDPVANAMAVVILIALASSIMAILYMGRQTWQIPAKLQQFAPLAAIGVSLLVALSLVAGTTADSLASVIAWAVLGFISIGTMLIVMTYFDSTMLTTNAERMIPLVILSGLLVAIYLAIVETTQVDAVCGTIGKCDAVQQSEYAYLFGIPIGVLGVIGYSVILLAWGAWKFGQVRGAATMLLALTTFGAVFSSYLTFLEPFVIGATCAWCLMSALTMLTLLWLVAPAGWKEFHTLMSQSSESSQTI